MLDGPLLAYQGMWRRQSPFAPRKKRGFRGAKGDSGGLSTVTPRAVGNALRGVPGLGGNPPPAPRNVTEGAAYSAQWHNSFMRGSQVPGARREGLRSLWCDGEHELPGRREPCRITLPWMARIALDAFLTCADLSF